MGVPPMPVVVWAHAPLDCEALVREAPLPLILCLRKNVVNWLKYWDKRPASHFQKSL